MKIALLRMWKQELLDIGYIDTRGGMCVLNDQNNVVIIEKGSFRRCTSEILYLAEMGKSCSG